MATAPHEADEAYVCFSSEINPDTAKSLLDTMASLANQGVARVVLCLSTGGGNIFNGTVLYNMLRAMPFDLVTHNSGHIASMGNTVFLAGDERFACPQATFLFHPSAFPAEGGKLFDVAILRERIAMLNGNDEAERLVLRQRTTMTAAEIRAIVAESRTLTAKDAVGAGIVSRVKKIAIPDGVPVISL
jgi:ATP-dependent Clp protease protease subunit